MFTCHSVTDLYPARVAFGGSKAARPRDVSFGEKTMIHLNLSIRRLVAGALLLATWGALTPTPGEGGTTVDPKQGCFDEAGNRVVRTTFPDGTSGVVNGINYANMGCFVSFVPIVVTAAKPSTEWNAPVQAPVVIRPTGTTSNPTVGVSPSS